MVDVTDRSTWVTVQDIHDLTHPEAAHQPSHAVKTTPQPPY
jgi:hypothetical protein